MHVQSSSVLLYVFLKFSAKVWPNYKIDLFSSQPPHTHMHARKQIKHQIKNCLKKIYNK